jgi:hypothetical protein
MSDRWDRVRARWAAHAVHTVPPATAVELAAFESSYGVSLPGDLRSYFAELGGMDPRAVPAYDHEGFAIWPLTEVRRTESDPRLFVIADYLNWSWVYAIELGVTADRPHPIVMLGTTTPQPVAESFAEFIDLYLSDSRLLYPTR